MKIINELIPNYYWFVYTSYEPIPLWQTVRILRNLFSIKQYDYVKNLISVSKMLDYKWKLWITDRKLQGSEFPHNIYIQNYSTATSTCITLRRWLFSPALETMLNSDQLAINFLFWEVMGISRFCCIIYVTMNSLILRYFVVLLHHPVWLWMLSFNAGRGLDDADV